MFKKKPYNPVFSLNRSYKFFAYKFLRLNSILYAYLQTVFKGKEIIISFYPRIYQINFTLEKGRTFFLIVSSKDDFNMKDRSLTKTLI